MTRIRARLARIRYRQAARWSPLVALAAGLWAADPGSVIRGSVLTCLALIVALEARDKKAARDGRLRLVPRCDCHETVRANEQRISRAEAENAELRAIVGDWDMALQAAGLTPHAPAWRRSG